MIAIAFVAALVIAAIGLSLSGVRVARTTSDLFVASRAISTWWNAAAISGEYLSAASFLGIAGLAFKDGAVALWQAVGFAAGYLALLLFVAAPLRRYGSYTIADFAEARVASQATRLLASLVVLGITGFYLVPQLKGAGIALQEVTSAPYWAGVVTVGVIVALGVALGGMRGITYVQAFQFWVKLFAIAAPALALVVYLGGLPSGPSLFGSSVPRAPASGLTVHLASPVQVRFPAASTYRVNGIVEHARVGSAITLPAGTLALAAGTPLPTADGITAQTGARWARPVGGGADSSALFVYSLLLATFLGTMGLPHILVRFYTNPDGPAARRTTVNVLVLIGIFYLFPGIYAALGREFTPGLYITGQTDTVVLRVPEAVWPGLPGEILGGICAAGAFAAFMSASSGLLVSIAGTLSHDLWPQLSGDAAPVGQRGRLRFRVAAVLGVIVPMAIALLVRGLDIGLLVGWAFALAASTFCPLFLLGIWWRGLTAPGVIAGIASGGGVATTSIFLDIAHVGASGSLGAVLAQPAIVSVPIAFGVMIAVSLLTPGWLNDPDQQWLALHAPEELGLERALLAGRSSADPSRRA
jgi:cation/acetate symporter